MARLDPDFKNNSNIKWNFTKFLVDKDGTVVERFEPTTDLSIVEEKIMLELKAVKQLEDVHLAQAINYLEAYNMEIGLLINFGCRSLQFKRVMKPKQNPSQNK